MRILITGGAGFIGLRLIKNLLELHPSAPICVFDNLHEQVHGPNAHFPHLPTHVTCVKADIQDKAAVDAAICSFLPTHVFHLAAETGTFQSMDEIQRYCSVNVQGTAILIESLLKHAPNLQQFVLASSRAVYGEGPWHNPESQTPVVPPARTEDAIRQKIFNPIMLSGTVLGEPIPATETASPQPTSVYASTKLMQEYLTLQSRLKSKSLIFRFQNVYGAGQSLRNPYTGVLSIFTARLLRGEPIEIFEDGQIVRDFIYVDDIASGLVLGLQKNIRNGEIINLGSGQPTTILQAAKTIADTLNASENLIGVSGNFRPGDIRYACGDTRKAQKILGWQPEITFREGISNLVKWSQKEMRTNA
ncbi:MAG: NAD-dependent epimerase/dehydratase family protein [Bdellovibrionaceae bacterium]|nr:NAD-dependent epimerase/dehydratase family protein [Pseudobdellovibrionaceae bacterium]